MSHRELKPLNPDWPKRIAIVLPGSLVTGWQNFSGCETTQLIVETLGR